ncbi:hypothetical protein GCM10020366_50730 [Saccharopolyspora gregorii]|uniref:Uncharacterized protein n=1 Tax=Saccharopolyspora gregorii TaxID=33914 RepID=A0ABP6RX70_9PSEU
MLAPATPLPPTARSTGNPVRREPVPAVSGHPVPVHASAVIPAPVRPARERTVPERTVPERAPAVPRRTLFANPAGAPADRSSGALAARLGEPVVDVLLGRRPLSQIKSRISPAVHALLKSNALRQVLHEPRARLHSLHARPVGADLVEGCAVISSPKRTRAVVLRWERGEAGWLCTFLAAV